VTRIRPAKAPKARLTQRRTTQGEERESAQQCAQNQRRRERERRDGSSTTSSHRDRVQTAHRRADPGYVARCYIHPAERPRGGSSFVVATAVYYRSPDRPGCIELYPGCADEIRSRKPGIRQWSRYRLGSVCLINRVQISYGAAGIIRQIKNVGAGESQSIAVRKSAGAADKRRGAGGQVDPVYVTFGITKKYSVRRTERDVLEDVAARTADIRDLRAHTCGDIDGQEIRTAAILSGSVQRACGGEIHRPHALKADGADKRSRAVVRIDLVERGGAVRSEVSRTINHWLSERSRSDDRD